jgi:hypothetical protein
MARIYVKSDKIIIGNVPTKLESIPSFGIVLYDPAHRFGYIANETTTSMLHMEGEIGHIDMVLDRTFNRLKKDGVNPSGLYALLVGDSIDQDGLLPEEDEPLYKSVSEARHAHASYRKAILDEIVKRGFDKNKVAHFFTKFDSCSQEVSLNTLTGLVKIKEFYVNPEENRDVEEVYRELECTIMGLATQKQPLLDDYAPRE